MIQKDKISIFLHPAGCSISTNFFSVQIVFTTGAVGWVEKINFFNFKNPRSLEVFICYNKLILNNYSLLEFVVYITANIYCVIKVKD